MKMTQQQMIDAARLAEVKAVTLASGGHDNEQNAFCVMEAVAYVAGEPWSDSPQCASPVIAAFLRSWNDSLGDEPRNRLLKPLIPLLVGTKASDEVEEKRSYMALDCGRGGFKPYVRPAVLLAADKLLAAAPTPPVDAVPGEPVVLDGCELCNGRRGGVPGNENIIDGKRVCDYCHSDSVAVPGEPMVLDELRATICGVGIVGQIDGDDVIRRESVIDLIDRRRLAASVASRAGSEPVAWEVLILGEWRPTRFPDELRAKGYEVRIALPDRERAASLVASEGLSIAQEPKYTVNGSAIMNRASGEAIPADEPVFIFRARDVRAVGALSRYASVVALHSSEDHWLAVMGRIDDFVRFRRDHPERMKEPDTDRASAEEAQS
jgi:hypothetical protein